MIQSTIVASQALAILGLVAACLTVVVGVVLISFNKKQKPLPNKALAFVPAVTGAGAFLFIIIAVVIYVTSDIGEEKDTHFARFKDLKYEPGFSAILCIISGLFIVAGGLLLALRSVKNAREAQAAQAYNFETQLQIAHLGKEH